MSTIENPWRRAYEARAALGWAGATGGLLAIAAGSGIAAGPSLYMASLTGVFACMRTAEAMRIWNAKLELAGRGILHVLPATLLHKIKGYIKQNKPQQVYVGKGFNWEVKHSQRLYDIELIEKTDILPPDWFLKLRAMLGKPYHSADEAGAPWIHGVGGGDETDVYIPLKHLEGHSIVFGSTGSGKTRFAETLVAQAIMRGEVVIMIDPKYDQDLCDRMAQICAACGRAADFRFVHPDFPAQSARLDPLKNFGSATELASRIAALLPTAGQAATFTAFSWRAINVIAQALVDLSEQPTLRSIRHYLQSGPEALMERLLETYYKRDLPDWEAELRTYVAKASKGDAATDNASPKLTGYIAYYDEVWVRKGKQYEVIDGLLAATRHNREHYSKMTAALLPLLDMLTSGSLGELLSPNAMDLTDDRDILDSTKVIETGSVLYVALNALPNSTVAVALGSILLADFASTAGRIYNFVEPSKRRVVSMYVDEASEVINEPMIQILNKARGAGFRATLFSQTMADFEKKLGSSAAAQQVVGNLNNVFALRLKDESTINFITATFGEVPIRKMSRVVNNSTGSANGIGDFSGGSSANISHESMPLMQPSLFTKLPNFHFLASISGGRIVKGRCPLLTPIPEDEKFTTRLLKNIRP
jgi:conjugal transfer pilus assembly protein TraD